LEVVQDALPELNSTGKVVISDKDKGLDRAFAEWFPDLNRFACAHHLHNGTLTWAKVPKADQKLFYLAQSSTIRTKLDEVIRSYSNCAATTKFFSARPDSMLYPLLLS
jgi:hypothetical protein